jgi:hypothetical protein
MRSTLHYSLQSCRAGAFTVSGKVFINYRRDDDQGKDRLFMDVEGLILGGEDFVEELRAQVAQCDVLLAVIGPRWLTVADEGGRRRLDNPEDWVRVEIEGALETGKHVMPVLVGGAGIPRADDLPEPLRPLTRLQAIRVMPDRFNADAAGLVSQVKTALAQMERARAAATEVEHAAERRRRAEEAARLAERERQEAERARQHALANLSPEQIQRALEVENWAFVKDKNDPAELRDHIARFAGGPTERFAAERLASLVWARLGTDKRALQAFLDEFPKAREADDAQARIDAINAGEAIDRAAAERRAKETAEWAAVASSTDKVDIEAFLKTWPDGAHAADAKARLRELQGDRLDTTFYVLGAFLGSMGFFALVDILLRIGFNPPVGVAFVAFSASIAALSVGVVLALSNTLSRYRVAIFCALCWTALWTAANHAFILMTNHDPIFSTPQSIAFLLAGIAAAIGGYILSVRFFLKRAAGSG